MPSGTSKRNVMAESYTAKSGFGMSSSDKEGIEMSALRLTLVFFAALSLSGAAGPAGPSAEAVRADVQAFMNSYIAAQNKVDATAIMEKVSNRSGVASITMGEITRGWEAIRAEVDKGVGSEGELKMALGTIDVQE